MSESLGKILKKIRESKNLSLDDVSERSRIPKHTISSLEEDNFSEFKSIFYAKSFVKTYSSFLGAMNESSVKEFIAKDPGMEEQKKPEIISKPLSSPVKVSQVDFSILDKHKKQILAAIIGIFVVLALFFVIGQTTKAIKSMLSKKQNKIVKTVLVHESAKTPVKRKKQEPVNMKIDGVELKVSASRDTWLQVTSDGNMIFTGLFKKGSQDKWIAKKEIKLEVADSSVVKIKANGKIVNFPGKKGEKKEIVITKDGIIK
jgi:transcriptional regulator with XRE-family HTH domain